MCPALSSTVAKHLAVFLCRRRGQCLATEKKEEKTKKTGFPLSEKGAAVIIGQHRIILRGDAIDG
jgi:hypothetical protein